jgi:molybdopterin-binding protein
MDQRLRLAGVLDCAAAGIGRRNTEVESLFKKEQVMKYGAQNQLTGKVSEIKKGTVMCEVKLDLTGPGAMASVMTLDSLEDLNLKPGDSVKIIVKAVNVLVVKE